ncbi:hypothetical protein BDW02DRAFT_628178 [Decorospora gaudefroyi]|uniref:Uncharacterized protein n=1 Tax=Decorospora gaudefroyi TaxID=184978 RepID=A0A6A5KG42_9PLEO|nr:hypothetical protein BDW02DRAFT_628178 [Decorospora gaudefroyi]
MLPAEELIFYRAQIGPPFSPHEYKPQEEMLFKIDHYLDKAMDPKSRRPADLFQQIEAWDTLVDLCEGASLLLDRRGHGKAQVSMDQFFDRFESMFHLDDLSFVVTLWQICVRLRGIEHRWPDSKMPHKFFVKIQELVRHGRHATEHYDTDQHPLFVIASSLCKVKDADFKDTLRICFFKTIKTLMAILGPGHSVVLRLLCIYYAQFHWTDKAYPHKNELMTMLKNKINIALQSDNEDEIFSSYHHAAYAAYHVCGSLEQGCDYAREILLRVSKREHGIPLRFNATWTPIARALFLAVKLLHSKYRVRQQEEETTHYTTYPLEYAITRFETGGSEHHIRACTLSASLAKYYTRQGWTESAAREQDRTKRLLGRVAGQQICLLCEERKRSWAEFLEKNVRARAWKQPHLKCARCYMEEGHPALRRKKRYRGLKGARPRPASMEMRRDTIYGG